MPTKETGFDPDSFFIAIQDDEGNFRKLDDLVWQKEGPAEWADKTAESIKRIAFIRDELERAGFYPHQAFELIKIILEGEK